MSKKKIESEMGWRMASAEEAKQLKVEILNEMSNWGIAELKDGWKIEGINYYGGNIIKMKKD